MDERARRSPPALFSRHLPRVTGHRFLIEIPFIRTAAESFAFTANPVLIDGKLPVRRLFLPLCHPFWRLTRAEAFSDTRCKPFGSLVPAAFAQPGSGRAWRCRAGALAELRELP
jgi:hypothetical protein